MSEVLPRCASIFGGGETKKTVGGCRERSDGEDNEDEREVVDEVGRHSGGGSEGPNFGVDGAESRLRNGVASEAAGGKRWRIPLGSTRERGLLDLREVDGHEEVR